MSPQVEGLLTEEEYILKGNSIVSTCIHPSDNDEEKFLGDRREKRLMVYKRIRIQMTLDFITGFEKQQQNVFKVLRENKFELKILFSPKLSFNSKDTTITYS